MGTRGRPKKEAACRTCKIRRVKCDETKPECRRCTSTGRKCDGYASLSSSVIPYELFSSSQELRSFKFFCEKTSLEITSHYDETFWQNLVLQLSHSNAGLGHLVIAIGSLHESVKETPVVDSNSTLSPAQISFSLQQCNKAISILKQQPFEGSNIGVLMTSCILFMAFEMLQNRLDTALHQFKIGMRMLRTWRENQYQTMTTSERDLIENHLSPILNRFGESSGLIAALEDDVSDVETPSASGSESEKQFSMPRVFLSLGQARTSLHAALDHIFGSLSRATDTDDTASITFYNQFSPILGAWHTQFRHFVDNLKDDVGSSHKRRVRLMEIQYAVSNISLAVAVFKDEMIYDRYVDEFGRIVKLCIEVVEIETGAPFTGEVTFMSFSFDLGIIMPLYFTASKCRDPFIRRQALHVLQKCPRREGIWLSWVTGMVAEQIILIEEDGQDVKTSEDVSMTNRIRLMHMHYDPCLAVSQDSAQLYQPIVQLSWTKLDGGQDSLASLNHKTIQLPPTSDQRPGLRPYWVILPSGQEINYWKLLLGKKVFQQPENTIALPGAHTDQQETN